MENKHPHTMLNKSLEENRIQGQGGLLIDPSTALHQEKVVEQVGLVITPSISEYEGVGNKILSLWNKLEPMFLDKEAYGGNGDRGEYKTQRRINGIREIRETLSTYTGNLSSVLEKIAIEWRRNNPYWNGNDFLQNRITGEEVIMEFENYLSALEASAEGSFRCLHSEMLFFIFQEVINALNKEALDKTAPRA